MDTSGTVGNADSFSDDFIAGVQSAVDVAKKEFDDVIKQMAEEYEEKCRNHEE